VQSVVKNSVRPSSVFFYSLAAPAARSKPQALKKNWSKSVQKRPLLEQNGAKTTNFGTQRDLFGAQK
jgi:hypothetical protein